MFTNTIPKHSEIIQEESIIIGNKNAIRVKENICVFSQVTKKHQQSYKSDIITSILLWICGPHLERNVIEKTVTQEVTYNAYIVILGKVINIPIVHLRLSNGHKNFSNNHCYLHMGNN